MKKILFFILSITILVTALCDATMPFGGPTHADPRTMFVPELKRLYALIRSGDYEDVLRVHNRDFSEWQVLYNSWNFLEEDKEEDVSPLCVAFECLLDVSSFEGIPDVKLLDVLMSAQFQIDVEEGKGVISSPGSEFDGARVSVRELKDPDGHAKKERIQARIKIFKFLTQFSNGQSQESVFKRKRDGCCFCCRSRFVIVHGHFIHKAAQRGNCSVLNILLDIYTDNRAYRASKYIDVTDKLGWTALEHAAYAGHEDAVRFLLGRGALIRSAISRAANQGIRDIIRAAQVQRLAIDDTEGSGCGGV